MTTTCKLTALLALTAAAALVGLVAAGLGGALTGAFLVVALAGEAHRRAVLAEVECEDE